MDRFVESELFAQADTV